MTITLADVLMILGLPITGSPIYFDESLKGDYLIRRYLGMEPPANQGESLLLKMTWLRDNFMYVDRIGDRTIQVDDFRVICCTRAYLLSMCGGFLFPDGTGNKVNVSVLPFFEDLGTCTKHAWGAAVLAHVYSSMTTFVHLRPGRKIHPNISGCLTLVQLWCHEHFDIGRPATQYTPDQRVMPAGIRWNADVTDTLHRNTKMVSLYRHFFDTKNALQVTWQPVSVPQHMVDSAMEASKHRFYIIYHGHIMFHPADRVMRQFGMKQLIPEEPLSLGRGRATITARLHSIVPGWDERFTTHGIEQMCQPVETQADWLGSIWYIQWYGIPRMQNPLYQYEEPRIQPQALDDATLRLRSRQVDVVLQNVEELSQDPMVDPRELLETSVDYLSQPYRPPILPLHLPEDHPVGIVRERRARPRRPYGRRGDRRRDREAGEGTSQPRTQHMDREAGEGTSHPRTQHMDISVGEGTSQPRTQHMDISAGEGTSQLGGDYWDYYMQMDREVDNVVSQTGGDYWDSIFGTPQFDTTTQLYQTPTAPVATNETDEFDPWEPLPGETPEDTVARRNRLGLRPRPRRYYDRMARGLE